MDAGDVPDPRDDPVEPVGRSASPPRGGEGPEPALQLVGDPMVDLLQQHQRGIRPQGAC